MAKQTEIDDDTAGQKRTTAETLTRTGVIMGTPSYMAPEQARGESKKSGPATDIWALGAILYKLLTGRPPFLGATSLDTIMQVIDAEPVPPRTLVPGLSFDLQTICLKCLRKESAKRYPSAEALAEDLRRWRGGEPILARPTRRMERSVKWVKRNPIVSGLLTAIVLLFVIGSAGIYAKYRQAKNNEAKANVALKQADDDRQELNYNLALDRVLLAQAAFDNDNAALAHERLGQVPPELRKWEWHYLKRLYFGEILTLDGHTGAVFGASFRPDGLSIITISSDSTAKVWNAKTGKFLQDLRGHDGKLTTMRISPDGSRIVTASSGGMA